MTLEKNICLNVVIEKILLNIDVHKMSRYYIQSVHKIRNYFVDNGVF